MVIMRHFLFKGLHRVFLLCGALACGQLGEAEFNLGANPSIGLGPYKRTITLESPHGQEFSWSHATPCPDGSLLILAGDRARGKTWLTDLRDLNESLIWQETTQLLPGINDAAMHCTASTIFIFALVKTEEGSSSATLWEFDYSIPLAGEAKRHTTFAIPETALSPSLILSETNLDTSFLNASEEPSRVTTKRFERTSFEASQTMTEELPATESIRDLSIRRMRKSNQLPLTVWTAFGRLDGQDCVWMFSDDLQSPTVVDIGESYSSQTLVEWRGSFWFMGTRLRGTVPLGLVLSREVEGIPTLNEIH